MLKKIILPILLGSTIAFTSGISVSNKFDQSSLLNDIQMKASKLAQESDIYVLHSNMLDKNADLKGEDIKNLIVKIKELKDFNGGLRDEIKILEEELGTESEENKIEIDRLKLEIDKASLEMSKAEDIVIQYRSKVQDGLSTNKYKYIDVGTRTPIEDIVKPEAEGIIPIN